MAEAPGPDGARRLCASHALAERGRAQLFDVVWRGQRWRAFALRVDGRVVAYLNRCAHRPAELDWTPGEFLDAGREQLVCAVHGAAYDPHDGRCLGGPCGRGRLEAIDVVERADGVYWYPSKAMAPPSADAGST
jgi:nitrite reductase/ring-hydroxylating ferredoxin subunit